MKTATRLIGWALAICWMHQVAAGAGEDYLVEHVDYGTPLGASTEIQTKVREILARDGLIALANVPGLAAARTDALVASARCVLMTAKHEAPPAPLNVVLKDASKRASWAAFVREPVDTTPQCPGLQKKMEHLRSVVDLGSRYFAELLDSAIREEDLGGAAGLFAKTNNAGAYVTFKEVLEQAKHLDHFHVYEKRHIDDDNADLALDLHTDQGLFIGIVPSIRESASAEALVDKEEDSFQVELSDKRIANVKLPFSGDVLLFMIGDGFNYVTGHKGVRPVPHALSLKPSKNDARAWFGRMFFAPNDAMLSANGETFDSVVETVMEARRLNQDFPTLACGQIGRVLHDPTGSNCSAGTAYCWMSCRSTQNLTCADHDAVCQNSVTGAIWVDCPTCHDVRARLVCPTQVPTSSPVNPSAGGVGDFYITQGPTTSMATTYHSGDVSHVLLVLVTVAAMMVFP